MSIAESDTPTRPGIDPDYDAVMRWVAPVMVETSKEDLDAARAEQAEAAREARAVPGSHWPRNPATAPTSARALAVLEKADDQAVDLALRELDRLLDRAMRHTDLARRARMLARVDRALADPKRGIAKRLREARTATLGARHAARVQALVSAGVPVRNAVADAHAKLASEAGVSTRRIRALLAANPTYESAERQDVRANLKAERDARAAARQGQLVAERQVALQQGHAWNARMWAGETIREIAVADGVPWQRVASWVKTARETGAEAAA
ncbi:hypothetical protein IC607_08725 [Cellulomonas sp. JH27-2]|uniref:hypothetical protein n=1 Tax=Cellulomonas sp. JH27-2 TaxID=2774139 RepID=UPI00178210E3|nr:hypothetical protein [Cellulomonas sp. JH27-2]MBD8059051.1 hypothetical protein [Cellulomonas sp. JH27-2]